MTDGGEEHGVREFFFFFWPFIWLMYIGKYPYIVSEIRSYTPGTAVSI